MQSVMHSGAKWCRLEAMATPKKSVRKSVSLPPRIAEHVRVIARTRRTSDNRVLVDLIEAGLQSKEAEKVRFFALADRLSRSQDSDERSRIKKELARMTFGE
jgi:hypothetical protein